MTSEFTIAVHALVFLRHKGTLVASEALAKNVCTNPARIRKVMGKLKKSGLIVTREGMEGGYYLKPEASDMNLRVICEAIGGKAVSANWKSGGTENKCLISSGMADVMDEIYGQMEESCLKRLEIITIKDIEDKIFQHFGKKV